MCLYAATTVFVSTFQPLMKLSLVPVVLFGAVYFLNHLIRGISSKLTQKFVSYFGLENLITAGLSCVIFGFLFMLWAFDVKTPYLTLVALFYISLVIGLQLINQISNVNEIHNAISPNVRATGISIYNMLCRGFGGITLSLFQKISADFNIGGRGYFIFAIVFTLILALQLFSKSKRNFFK